MKLKKFSTAEIVLILVIIAIIIFNFWYFTQPAPDQNGNGNGNGNGGPVTWIDYTHSIMNYSVQYPSNWEYFESVPDRDLIIYGLEDDINDLKYQRVVVQHIETSEHGSNYSNIDDVVNQFVKMYITRFNYDKLSDNATTLAGRPARELVVIYTMNTVPLKESTIITKGDDYFYIILYISNEENHDSYVNVYEKVKETFQINETTETE